MLGHPGIASVLRIGHSCPRGRRAYAAGVTETNQHSQTAGDAAAAGGRHGRASTLRSVVKRFGDFTAVKGIDLEIDQGEFFTLLGPSGCGKTTTLRMIAGFEEPDEGQILIDGEDVAGLPAHKRPTNTVFQSYALFPHLSVSDNVAYGLKRKGVEQGRGRAAGPGRARARRALGRGEPQAEPALRRPAAARRARPRGRQPARRCCCSTSRSAPST